MLVCSLNDYYESIIEGTMSIFITGIDHGNSVYSVDFISVYSIVSLPNFQQ